MKLLIDQSPENEEVEIIIKCGLIDARLEKLIEQVRLYFFSVAAKRDGKTFQLRLEDIFYFESVDSHTFAYTEKEVYECSMRLYELEDQIAKTDFVRISKSCILNVTTLKNVRGLLNGRMEAELENGEKVVVTRHYVEALALKKKLSL